MAIGILVLFSLVLGLSYGTFIFSTGNYRSTSMLISNLLYGINITTTGGNETTALHIIPIIFVSRLPGKQERAIRPPGSGMARERDRVSAGYGFHPFCH